MRREAGHQPHLGLYCHSQHNTLPVCMCSNNMSECDTPVGVEDRRKEREACKQAKSTTVDFKIDEEIHRYNEDI